jgi:glycerophosphoryl diester phosphodiesterase
MRFKHALLLLIIFLIFAFFMRLPNITAGEEHIVIGAHRGINSTENTLESIMSAANDPKYNFVEIDVQMTKDGKIIVYHDYTLMRLYGKPVVVPATNYSDLCYFAGTRIPLLEDVLDLLDNKKLIVDIKGTLSATDNQILVDKIVSSFKSRGSADNLLISSIFPGIVEYSKRAHPNIKTGVSYMFTSITYIPSERLVENFYDYMDFIEADYIMLHEQHLKNYELIRDNLPKGKKLIFWSLDEDMYLMDTDIEQMW